MNYRMTRTVLATLLFAVLAVQQAFAKTYNAQEIVKCFDKAKALMDAGKEPEGVPMYFEYSPASGSYYYDKNRDCVVLKEQLSSNIIVFPDTRFTGSFSVSGETDDDAYNFFSSDISDTEKGGVSFSWTSDGSYPYYENITLKTYISSEIRIFSITIGDDVKPQFEWSKSSVSAVLGEEIDFPSLQYDENWFGSKQNIKYLGLKYTSSNENVAKFDAKGNIVPMSCGTTIITASVERTEGHPAATASYTLNIVPFSVVGSVEDIRLDEPNTLRDILVDMETTAIGSLTLHGKMGSDDLAVLHTNARFSNLQVLDLSDVTLVADEGLYNTISTREGSDVGLGSTTYKFYLSEREEVEEKSSPTGLGGGNSVISNYTMDLGGAFSGMPIKQLILPRTMTHIGDRICYGCGSLLEVKSNITEGAVEDYAFHGCTNLRNINGIKPTSVGKYAFGSTKVSDIDLSKASTIGDYAFTNIYASNDECWIAKADLSSAREIGYCAFDDCSHLKEVTFGNSLTSIGDYAFNGCGFPSLKLPESLTTIGKRAFSNSAIETIDIPASLLHIDADLFYGTPWINAQEPVDGIIYLGNIALCCYSYINKSASTPTAIRFRQGTTAIANGFAETIYYSKRENVTSVEFPNSVRVIGDNAFSSLTNMAFTWPENIEYIGSGAFSSNKKITSLTLPASLTYVGSSAFSGNTSLMRLNFNAADAECGESLFARCTSLEKVTFAEGIREIPENCFHDCSSLSRVEFTENANAKAHANAALASAADDNPLEFRYGCFMGCSNLSKIDFPARTDSIGDNAFSVCALTKVDLTKGGRYIGSWAFNRCPVQTLLMGPRLASMDADAFIYCQNLTSIYAYATTPPEITGRNKYDFTKLAKTAMVYTYPELLYVYDADEVWTKFTITEMDDEHKALVDGISEVKTDADSQDVIYDLQGRRVKNPSHGIYIVNGRKVLK